ncbi:hypothetical protein RUM44_000640 [Polyplax serrata]|uniref:Uncharacterized protein n=1 Tax=Polyplax serrata TaxID=468196 RepID=A0ABR1B892_POLSC
MNKKAPAKWSIDSTGTCLKPIKESGFKFFTFFLGSNYRSSLPVCVSSGLNLSFNSTLWDTSGRKLKADHRRNYLNPKKVHLRTIVLPEEIQTANNAGNEISENNSTIVRFPKIDIFLDGARMEYFLLLITNKTDHKKKRTKEDVICVREDTRQVKSKRK